MILGVVVNLRKQLKNWGVNMDEIKQMTLDRMSNDEKIDWLTKIIYHRDEIKIDPRSVELVLKIQDFKTTLNMDQLIRSAYYCPPPKLQERKYFDCNKILTTMWEAEIIFHWHYHVFLQIFEHFYQITGKEQICC